MQIHGRKCTYTTPQPLVSAYFPCDKKRTEKETQEIVIKLNLNCMQHKATEDLLQSHDFNSFEFFPSNTTKDKKAEL